jgi:adenylate cyclase class IV
MPRNIEIKTRISSVEALLPLATALADRAAEVLVQDDTFFAVAHGRLKLREFADGSAELIHYQRPDQAGARVSDYVRLPVPDAARLREALARGCGVIGRVRKQRWLLLRGQTRIHLDSVDELGDFMELEVVLQSQQTDDEGQQVARALMAQLGLSQTHALAGSYLDLLSDAAD